MRTGLGLGYGLGLIGPPEARHVIAITTLAASLELGESAEIAGTSSAEGSLVVVTVNGVAWGSAVVSGGVWSVTSTPTEAMIGTGVAVVVSVSGVSASGTTDVANAEVAFTDLPAAVFVGDEATIEGTASGASVVQLYLGGVLLGASAVVAGVWSVTATVAASMASTSAVTATAVAGGQTASGSIAVVADLAGRWDSDVGVTTSDAAISADLENDWTGTNLTAAANGSTFDLTESVDGGSVDHYIEASATNFQAGRLVRYTFRAKAQARGYAVIFSAVDNVGFFVDLSDGSVTSFAGSGYPSGYGSSAPDSEGYCEFYFEHALSSAAIRLYATNDGTPSANYQGDGSLAISAKGVSVQQRKVTSWNDRAPATISAIGKTVKHVVAQATAAQQPLYLGEGAGLEFDNDNLATALADLGELAYVHQESTIFVACERTAVAASTGVLVSTANGTSTQHGVNLYDSSGTTLHYRVSNGAGYAVSATGAKGTYGTGLYVVTAAFDASTAEIRALGAEETSVSTGTISTSDASGNLRLGQTIAAAAPLTGKIFEVIAFYRKLSAAEIAQVEQYLSARWSVPFAISSLSDLGVLYAHWAADVGVTTRVDGPNQYVTSWTDSGTAGADATQAVAVSQPGYTPSAQNGLPLIQFAGTDDYLTLGAAITSETDFAILVAGSFATNLATQYVFDVGTGAGGSRVGFGTDAQDDLFWFDTSSKGGSVDAGTAFEIFALQQVGAVGDIWKGGAIVESDTAAGNPLDEDAAIGARNDGSAAFFTGDVGEIAILAEPTTAKLKLASNYLATKWAA